MSQFRYVKGWTVFSHTLGKWYNLFNSYYYTVLCLFVTAYQYEMFNSTVYFTQCQGNLTSFAEQISLCQASCSIKLVYFFL